ncbi:MAG: hypothetical protein HQL22_07160 [Candidatus Omnitrophica bacterium]|nr:hypothetical protein [Candidatus Omnitrophota bacterium]
MTLLKNVLKKPVAAIFRALGYDVHPSGQYVPYRNFLNLTQAYERRLNEAGGLIAASDVRPKLLARLIGTPPAEAYFILEALARTRDIAGDVCEFGVAQGETSALIASEILTGGKRFHLFDSFEGLPKPTAKDQLKDDLFSLGSMEAYAGTMASPEALVRARLGAVAFPPARFVIHKGFVEQVFARGQGLPNRVSFAYVDFDFYNPIKETLAFLHRIMPAGGVIIVDDYDFFSTGAKTSVDEFLQAMNAASPVYACEIPDTRYGHFVILTKKA